MLFFLVTVMVIVNYPTPRLPPTNTTLQSTNQPVEACLCVIQLDVPPANAVAVVIGNDWTQLERLGRSSTVWEGAVDMTEFFGRESKKLFICADCGSGVTSSYHTLLEYTV